MILSDFQGHSSDVYFIPICLLDTSASSALRVFDNNCTVEIST